jgi:molecular chaperone GrpE
VTERHKPDTAHEPVEGEVVEPEPVEAEVVEPEPVEPEVVEGEVVEAEVVEPQVTDASTPGADGADGDVEVTDDLQAAADALEVDLELLLSEREQYLDAYRRAQADFVEKLLPVLDACDAALAHGAQEVEPVLAALYGALGKEGLERIDPKGAAFDPAEAEAVMHEPGGGGEQVVSEVLRAGYRWQGRVLRPAMVKVID